MSKALPVFPVQKSKQPNQYTISESGDVFISQSAAAALFNVSRKTIYNWIKVCVAGNDLNDFNQLSSNGFSKLLIFAKDSRNLKAIELVDKVVLAGVKVFLYGMAGKEAPDSKQTNAITALTTQISEQQYELSEKDSKIEQQQGELFEKQAQINQMYRNGIKNPRAHLIQQKHKQYLLWVEMGFLIHEITTITKHNYNITNLGKQHLHQIQANQFELLADESEVQFELVC